MLRPRRRRLAQRSIALHRCITSPASRPLPEIGIAQRARVARRAQFGPRASPGSATSGSEHGLRLIQSLRVGGAAVLAAAAPDAARRPAATATIRASTGTRGCRLNGHALRSSGGATSRPRSWPRTRRRSQQGRPPPALPGRHRQGRQPRRQARLRRLHRRVAQDASGAAATTSRPRSRRGPTGSRPTTRKHRLAELIQSGGVGRWTGPARRPAQRPRRHDRHRPQLGHPRGRHRLRPAVRDHRRADQPDRPQAARRGDEGRRLQPGRARRRSPRSRPAPTCSTSTPGIPLADEPAILARTIQLVQSLTDLPLSIDSSIVEALEAGLAVYQGKPLVNSVTGEEERLERVLPLVRRYGAAVVAISQRRDRHQRGPRRPVRGREADRRAGRGPRHPARGHRRRPAGHADRRDARPPAGRCSALVRPAARRARGQHDLRRLQRQLRPAATARASTRAFLPMAIASGLTSAITNPLMPEVKAQRSWPPTC